MPPTESCNRKEAAFLLPGGTVDLEQILGIIGIVIGAASAIAAATPTPKDDVIIGKVYKIIDLLALNVGKAKDK